MSIVFCILLIFLYNIWLNAHINSKTTINELLEEAIIILAKPTATWWDSGVYNFNHIMQC